MRMQTTTHNQPMNQQVRDFPHDKLWRGVGAILAKGFEAGREFNEREINSSGVDVKKEHAEMND